jgi:hypothetical protein
VMVQEEFERALYAERSRHAAAIDRRAGSSSDRELSSALSAVRGRLDTAQALLSGRHDFPRKSERRPGHERKFPWDKI